MLKLYDLEIRFGYIPGVFNFFPSLFIRFGPVLHNYLFTLNFNFLIFSFGVGILRRKVC